MLTVPMRYRGELVGAQRIAVEIAVQRMHERGLSPPRADSFEAVPGHGAIATVEGRLQRSLRNEEVLQLLRYQNCLVYFTTGLKSNQLVMQRLQRSRLFSRFEEDEELLEDVLIENSQALEMTQISENILGQDMDAYASIISNNLNVVMKFLASATIIVSVPTLLASIYGMNVDLPLQGSPYAFVVVMGVALLLVMAMLWLFWRRDWL